MNMKDTCLHTNPPAVETNSSTAEALASPSPQLRFAEAIAKVEAEHERRYLKLLSRLTDGDFFHRDGKIWWQCRNCGYIVEAQDAPKTCPACLFPQAYFEPMKENY